MLWLPKRWEPLPDNVTNKQHFACFFMYSDMIPQNELNLLSLRLIVSSPFHLNPQYALIFRKVFLEGCAHMLQFFFKFVLQPIPRINSAKSNFKTEQKLYGKYLHEPFINYTASSNFQTMWRINSLKPQIDHRSWLQFVMLLTMSSFDKLLCWIEPKFNLRFSIYSECSTLYNFYISSWCMSNY